MYKYNKWFMKNLHNYCKKIDIIPEDKIKEMI